MRRSFVVHAAITALLLLLPALVRSQPSPRPAAPRLEAVRSLGCLDCGGPLQFSDIWDVALGDSGEVVVVDKTPPILRVFDASGKPVWEGGRNGSGPGEYRYAQRVAVGPGRSLEVLDMNARRLTSLSATGEVKRMTPFNGFSAAVAARARTGELVVFVDDFRGAVKVQRWEAGATQPVEVTTLESPQRAGFVQPAAAVSRAGELAWALDIFAYRIERRSADGRPLAPVTRDLPPLKRTDEEMAAMERRRIGSPGKQAAEKSAGGARGGRDLRGSGIDYSLKPHIAGDGLRYDDAGRLWVQTLRGEEGSTTFDVFTPAGTFAGSVSVPLKVLSFSLAGPMLATAGENADGIPVVSLWRVR